MKVEQAGTWDRRQFVAAAASSMLVLPSLRAQAIRAGRAPAREFMWQRNHDNLSFERAQYFPTDSGCTILGSVYAAEHGLPLTVSYELTCDVRWRTSALNVEQIYGNQHRVLRLVRLAGDHWLIDGHEAPALLGCTDVDLEISPSTNALPVNRLRLAAGEEAAIKAAWIRFPSLAVVAANQSYTRVAQQRYRYRSLDSEFEAMLDVDTAGFPVEYHGIWRQVASGAPARRAEESMTDALAADAPHASLGTAAEVFAPLVGSWDITCKRWSSDGKEQHSTGVWHFGWIIDGRMMQDAIYFNDRPSGERVGGTTLRMYDPQARHWRVIFFAPARGAIISLAGGREDERIVLLGKDVDGSALRWSFNDITQDSCHWIGEISVDEGERWRVEQEMWLKRPRPKP